MLPHDEEPLLDALARLHARGADGLGEGTRLIGTFRADGLLVPVWDLAPGTEADAVEAPAAAFAGAARGGARRRPGRSPSPSGGPAPGWRTVRSRCAETAPR